MYDIYFLLEKLAFNWLLKVIVQKDYLLNPFSGKSLQETIEKVKVFFFYKILPFLDQMG